MSTPGPTWRESSYSSGGDGDCIEVAECPETVHVRDSKDAEGPRPAFSATERQHFLAFARTVA